MSANELQVRIAVDSISLAPAVEPLTKRNEELMFIRIAKPTNSTTYECTSYHIESLEGGIRVLAHNRGEVALDKVITKQSIDDEWLTVFVMSERGDTIDKYTF